MRQVLPERDPEIYSLNKGRPPRLDYIDLTALVLRYFQTASLAPLCIEFGAVESIISRGLKLAQPIFFEVLQRIPQTRQVLQRIPQTRHEYPSKEYAEKMYNAAKIQHGEIPEKIKVPYPIALVVDGTFTNTKQSSNSVQNNIRHSANKGDGLNHIFMINFFGLVVDYDICRLGTTHDSRAVEFVFQRLKDPYYNPGKVGVIADSGFKGHAEKNVLIALTDAPVYVAVQNFHNFAPADRKDLHTWSNWLTSGRQCIEMFNGGLKKSFPYIVKDILQQDEPDFCMNMQSIIMLWNYRTRVLGYNQVKSIYEKNVDKRFEKLLRCKTAEDYINIAMELYVIDDDE